jgi:hypothetical protein
MSADELNDYDAETVRLTVAAEQRIAQAEATAAGLAGEARAAKKRAKEEASELRRMIRDRQDGRGKAPQPTLLDMVPTAPAWESLPVAKLNLPAGIAAELSFVPNLTCGELNSEVCATTPDAETGPFGLSHGDVAEIRMALAELRDREHDAKPAPTVPDDLWRSYPIERWTRFGLTAKDVEKLAAGEVRGKPGTYLPIRTVGELSEFTAPSSTGFTYGYADVKGIGAAGADRISDAETRFWSYWRDGGEEEFARERGLIRGDATSARPGSGATAAAVGGADQDDDDTETYTPDAGGEG